MTADIFKRFIRRKASLIGGIILLLFLLMALLCVLGIQSLFSAVASGAVNASAPVIPLALAYAAPVVGYALGMIAYITRALNAKKGGGAK